MVGNMHTFCTAARMDKERLNRFVILLRGAGLEDAHPHISVKGEDILVHIHVWCGLSNRKIMDRFQHSGEVIIAMRSIDHIFMGGSAEPRHSFGSEDLLTIPNIFLILRIVLVAWMEHSCLQLCFGVVHWGADFEIWGS